MWLIKYNVQITVICKWQPLPQRLHHSRTLLHLHNVLIMMSSMQASIDVCVLIKRKNAFIFKADACETKISGLISSQVTTLSSHLRSNPFGPIKLKPIRCKQGNVCAGQTLKNHTKLVCVVFSSPASDDEIRVCNVNVYNASDASFSPEAKLHRCISAHVSVGQTVLILTVGGTARKQRHVCYVQEQNILYSLHSHMDYLYMLWPNPTYNFQCDLVIKALKNSCEVYARTNLIMLLKNKITNNVQNNCVWWIIKKNNNLFLFLCFLDVKWHVKVCCWGIRTLQIVCRVRNAHLRNTERTIISSARTERSELLSTNISSSAGEP